MTVRIATEPFHCLDRSLHILIALNKETVEIHKKELTKGSVLLFDPNDYDWKNEELPDGVVLLPVPFREFVQKKGIHLQPFEEVYIGEGKKDKIPHII